MPQLDIYAFGAVVSWLLIIVVLLYNVILGTGLSRIYKILLYRKKKLEYYNLLNERLEKELYFVSKINLRFLFNIGKLYKSSPQISNAVVEKSMEIEKEFVFKEYAVVKNWLETRGICLELVGKDEFLSILYKDRK